MKVEVQCEFLFELKSKQEWANKVPGILPAKTRHGEIWLWVDKDGYVFECGRDFMAAEEKNSYPCKVYRAIPVANCSDDSQTTKGIKIRLKY